MDIFANIVQFLLRINMNKFKTYIYFKWLDKKGYAVCDGVTENIGFLDQFLLILGVLGILIVSYISLRILNFKHKE